MSGPRIRVAILSEGKESASEVFRVRWLLPALRREGIDPTLFPSRPGKYEAMTLHLRLWKVGSVLFNLQRLARRLADFPALRDFDVVLLQRDLLTLPWAPLERLLFRIHRRVVFDFDDALYFTPRADGTFRESARRRRKIERILRGSRAVAAGSRALVEFVRPIQPRVAWVPTTVDTQRFVPRPRAPGPVTVGWIGIPANQVYLAPLVPVLRNFPEVRIRVVSRRFRNLRLPNVEYVPWSREREPEEVARFDIGLSPLPDTEWTRAKCGARVLLYMACGVPPVCSPVGANAQIVTDGRTGLHAVSPGEWERAIDRLVRSARERTRLGAAARRHVERNFTPDVAAAKLAALLREVAS